ncbi:YraN family protein [uncultured Gimesia sp.]|uniref:YraN family protein n=1 Tax=uncultured Gimesia sp. TaxID=1678688 RepID=UPI0026331234|nr:YraN family protein [uncultured Gimesia sp.]
MAGKWFGKLLGDKGERAAVRFLKRQGYSILARQYRTDLGEIDIIALDRETVVFIEVKTRQSDFKGQPYEAVTRQKQSQLTRLASAFLKNHQLLNSPARFDVISILWPVQKSAPEIQHFQNAFAPAGEFQFFT